MRFLTLTLNPAIDLVGTAEDISLGKVNRIQTLSEQAAGKGVNVAQILKRFGADVSVTGFFGRENADIFHQLFTQQGIDDRCIYGEGRTRTNVKITHHQQTTDLNFSGLSVSHHHWEHLGEMSKNWASEFDLVALCGSLPSGVSAQMFAQFTKNLSAYGVRWVLDSSGEALRQAVKNQPFLLKPNDEELQSLANTSKPLELDEQLSLAKGLCKGTTQYVLLSKGSDGAYLVSQNSNSVLHALLPCEQVVSTTGAGDSLLASFLFFHCAKNDELMTALQKAVTVATLVVESSGLKWNADAFKARLSAVHSSYRI